MVFNPNPVIIYIKTFIMAEMDKRQRQLTELNTYIEEVDRNLTNVLENLQWDQNSLLQSKDLVACKYDLNHKIPVTEKELHEKKCFLKTYGYVDGDILLPDPPENNYMTCIKLGNDEIAKIIKASSNGDPTFRRGMGPQGPEPLTLERIQCSYTADERRAIHDAVVAAAPACHDLSDLALLSTNGDEQNAPKAKSKMEILAELRDMKRRRTKYRVAAKTRNYSDVLRDVIKSQMEIYKDIRDDKGSITKIIDNHTKSDIATEINSNEPAQMAYKDIEESRRDNIHRSEPRDSFRKDSKSRYKYNEKYKEEDKSMKTFRETGNDVSRNRYKCGREYKDGDIKYYRRSNEEFRKRRTDEISMSKYRDRNETIDKEYHTSDDKRHEYDSRVKHKKRSDDNKFKGYQNERDRYSERDKKNGGVRYRR